MQEAVKFKNLGFIGYEDAWKYQEELLQENVAKKTAARNTNSIANTKHNLIICQHTPVYTLGKSGNINNVLLSEQQLAEQNIEFFNTNRGGDITYHGPGQIVAYPIFDLEKFYTDIGKYLRNLEEVVMLTLADYSIIGERSIGETGVWIDPQIKGSERKICAIGVRCSRWITMHGFALNVNTNLNYFNNIVPCGIVNKKVTSIEQELQKQINEDEVIEKIKNNFKKVFDIYYE